MQRVTLPENWLPECNMNRIIMHWSYGKNTANDTDREHYHFVVNGDGEIIRGVHSIRDNVSTSDGDYAAHTRGSNTRTIGISMAGMWGAKEQPFRAGSYSLSEVQIEAFCQLAAILCKKYEIVVTNTTVLGHCEVQPNLGILQNGKWDPIWKAGQTPATAGNELRRRILGYLSSAETPAKRQVEVLGTLLDGIADDDQSTLVPVRALCDAKGWQLAVAGRVATVTTEDRILSLTLDVVNSVGYTEALDLAESLEAMLRWDTARRVVVIQ
jgi:hypothetical protein